MSWLDYIVVSLIGIALIWISFIIIVKFVGMMKDVDD